MTNLIVKTQPTELYNLAAQSSVGLSFTQPLETAKVDGVGAIGILETVRTVNSNVRVFQASSSEIFGKASEVPQNERTPVYPRSPYATAKLVAYAAAKLYREAYGMYVCTGILYNHESSRRGPTFVTQKIVQSAVRISMKLQKELFLGNLDASRDWGHAKDFAECIWSTLQSEEPTDFVVATGSCYTVREFTRSVFAEVGIILNFEGKGQDEVGVDASSGTILVRVDPIFFRPSEPCQIVGDPSKAKQKLKWKPKYDFQGIIREMVHAYKSTLVQE